MFLGKDGLFSFFIEENEVFFIDKSYSNVIVFEGLIERDLCKAINNFSLIKLILS